MKTGELGPKLASVRASTAYVVVDGRGRELAKCAGFTEAVSAGHRLPAAVTVIGLPSAVPLTRVAHGEVLASEAQVRRAAHRWLAERESDREPEPKPKSEALRPWQDALTPEERRELARRGGTACQAARSPEEKRAIAHRGGAAAVAMRAGIHGMPPDKRAEIARAAGRASQTARAPEVRRELARRGGMAAVAKNAGFHGVSRERRIEIARDAGRASHVARKRAWWESLTPAERERWTQDSRAREEALTPEERGERTEKIRQGAVRRWAAVPAEERAEVMRKARSARQCERKET